MERVYLKKKILGIENEFIEEYKKNGMKAICKKYNISPGSLYRFLRSNFVEKNVKNQRRGRRLKDIDEKERKKIVEDYKVMISKDLKKKYNISEHTIENISKIYGFSKAKKRIKLTKKIEKAIVEDYKNGMASAPIGKKYGVYSKKLYEILGRNNIKIRTKERNYDPVTNTKKCCRCQTFLPIDHFCKSKNSCDGYNSKCKKCVVEINKEYYSRAEVKKSRAEKARDLRLRDPLRNIVNNAKVRAKKRGLEFDLDQRVLKVPQVCPVLGIPIFMAGGGMTDNSATLDRIDNDKGYTMDNVVIVSWRANKIKNYATTEELRKIADFYEKIARDKKI